MITIDGQKAIGTPFMKFKTMTLNDFDNTLLMNVLKGDNLYNSRAGSYEVNSNEYKNLFLNSLKSELASNQDSDLLYIYPEKSKLPESLCILEINYDNILTLKDILIKRDDMRLLKEFVSLAKVIASEIAKESDSKNKNTILFEVPVWNIKLKTNLFSVAKDLGFEIEEVGTGTNNLYSFEDKFKESTKNNFKNEVKILRVTF